MGLLSTKSGNKSFAERVKDLSMSRVSKLHAFINLRDGLKEDNEKMEELEREINNQLVELNGVKSVLTQNIKLNEKTIEEVERITG